MYIYMYIKCTYVWKPIYNLKMYVLPYVYKRQGLANAQFRCNVNSELCIRERLSFYTWAHKLFCLKSLCWKYVIQVEQYKKYETKYELTYNISKLQLWIKYHSSGSNGSSAALAGRAGWGTAAAGAAASVVFYSWL